MKDTLLIDGRIYISSKRAAEMSKYSNDYIGQLCRGGKVAAKMMGRVWFVDRDSLFVHKKAAEEVLFGKAESTATPYDNSAKDVSSKYEDSLTRGAKVTRTVRKTSIFPRRTVMALVMATVIFGGGYFAMSSGIFASHDASAETASASGLSGWVKGVIASIEGVFGHHDSAVADNQSYIPTDDQSSSTKVPSWNGMVVAPAGSSDNNTKQQIQSSFSDNVTITPDATGNAGVIKPVFKKSNGDDFVYVMVPVKDAKTASTSTKIN